VTVRLFVAVEVDDITRAQLASTRDALERSIAAAAVPPRITWVQPQLAHVTVRFLGETPDTQLPAVQEALSAVSIEAFDVRWTTIGTFGGPRRPRVIWIGASEGEHALVAVAHDVNRALDPLFGPGESRRFTPHITLARVREPGRGVDWSGAISSASWSSTITRVTAVTLFESRLSPKGPTYTALSSHG
jgi:RNA 2',3'-cyclic 3'-phosphodiesterase